jgi:PAS domain S-box-containing protein
MPALLPFIRRNLVVALVAVAGLLCSFYLYKAAVSWEEEELHRHLEQMAEVQTNALEARIQSLTDELRVLRGVFELQNDISQDEFRRITEPTLAQYPMLYGIGWAPRTGDAATASYRLARVNLRTVGPVAFGLDLAAESRRREAILHACDTANAAASQPITLQPDNLPGVLLALPVFRPGRTLEDVEARRANLLGMLVAGVDTESLFEDTVGTLFWDQLDFVVRAGDAAGEIIHRHAPRQMDRPLQSAGDIEDSDVAQHAKLRVGHRVWTISYSASPQLLAQHASLRPMGALALGLLLTAAITAHLLSLQRRQERIDQLVKEQTNALRISEDRFAHAMEATADGIWELDLIDSRLLYVSPRTEEMLGFAPGSFTRPDYDSRNFFVNAVERDRSQQALAEHIQTGKPYVVEVRARHAQGGSRWVRLRGIVTRNEAGLPLRLVGSLRDITEEHAAEAQRAHMLARFEALIQDTPLVMALGFNREHNVTLWNHAAERFFGFTPRQARGRRVRDLLPVAAEGEWFVDLLEDIWITGRAYGPRETAITVADGPRWMLLAIFPLQNGGRPVEVFAMGVDITDRVRAEQDLRLSETRFRDLSELSADWFWEQDADLRFNYFSSGLERSGVGMNEHLGKLRWELPIQLSEEAWQAHKADLAARRPFRDFEFRIINSEGVSRWFVANGIPLYDDNGEFVGYRGNGRDITARKQLEEELRQHRDHLEELVRSQTDDLRRAKEFAEQATRAKSDFLANMSHELRTPMHAVLSFARIGLLKADTVGPEKLRDYFEHIRAGGQRLLDLVNDLLDLSKLEAGRMEYAMARTDLRLRVHEVVAELAPLLETKKLVCDVNIDAKDCHTWGDPRRLDQVIRNLLGNALKFTPEGRKITVDVADDDMPLGRRASDAGMTRPALRLTVADQGIGIPESELESVFGKFTQSSLTTTGAGGTGLGLAICREIVQAHRGMIRARNRSEGGCAFDVFLPYDSSSAHSRKDSA